MLRKKERMIQFQRLGALGLVLASTLLLLVACGGGEPAKQELPTLTIYSGRGEELVKPIIDQFSNDTGVKVQVRWGSTSSLAAAILEEGANSPADVFWAQDAGALGIVAQKGRFIELPDSVLNRVDQRFRSPNGLWVGVTGRARVVAYNTKRLTEQDLPDSIFGFTDPRWRGRIGWPPTNGSFQAFVTALRVTQGEAETRRWLEGIKANQPRSYPNNSAALGAVASGEVDVAFINHYYLYTQLKEQGTSYPVRNYYPRAGDAGAMVNVAGMGVLDTSKNQQAALKFLDYMLSPKAQTYFAGDTPDDAFEYPLVQGVPTHPDLPPLSSIKTPNIDLSSLADLEGSLKLLRDTGVL